MTTLEQKLTRLINTKSDIRQKLISYGVDVPFETPFKEYANLIDQIKEVEFEETTLDQDLLQIIDLYEFLVNEEYEDYSYTAEEILQVHDLLDSINNGPIVEVRPDNEEFLTMPLCGKTRYIAGETFEINTYIIKFIHADGTIEDVTNKCTITPSTALTVDDEYVTISYADKTITQEVSVIADLPYMRLSYIESTGTQYIDTGVIPAAGYTATIDFQATSLPSSGESWVLAQYTSDAPWRCGFTNKTTFCTTNGFTYSQTSTPTARAIGNGACTKNGTLSLYLFSQHETSGAAHLANSKYRLYSCQIRNENNQLVRNYLPCYRKSDNAIGLWDTVENIFCENIGTGSFAGGVLVWE